MRRSLTLTEPLVVAIAILALVMPRSVEAKPACPAPRALLERTLDAHGRLVPCEIRSATVLTGAKDFRDKVLHVRMLRNDARHSVAWRADPELRLVSYTAGRLAVDYEPARKSFTRTRLGSDDNRDHPVFSVLGWIREALANADHLAVHPQLGHTRVARIRYRGLPCYQVTWDMALAGDDPARHAPASGPEGPPAPGTYIAPFRVLVVGEKDGLVRKVVSDLVTRPWKRQTQTIAYRFHRAPYPPSTFVFTPPRGATEEVIRLAQ